MTVIPGPTALINALVLSGKPAHKFVFEGFLPNRKIARRNRLKALAKLRLTVICYESCHRILASLEDMAEVFGDKQVVCLRELTKKFEEVKRDSAKGLIEHFKSQKPRGEFIIVL